MKFLILALLISGQVHADYYKADCHINIKSQKHPETIAVHIHRNEVTIQIYGKYEWCVFIDRYDDISFYECDKYKISFRDHMSQMTYGGRAYSCFYKPEIGE